MTRSAGAPALIFCISDGPASKLTITFVPGGALEGGGDVAHPRHHAMPPRTVISAALHSARPCFGRCRAKPSIVRINRERDLRISRLADHDRVS